MALNIINIVTANVLPDGPVIRDVETNLTLLLAKINDSQPRFEAVELTILGKRKLFPIPPFGNLNEYCDSIKSEIQLLKKGE